MNEIQRIDKIEGIKLHSPEPEQKKLAIGMITTAVELAFSLVRSNSPFLVASVAASLAATASIQTVSALLAVAITKCHLDSPPEDIEVRQNSSGRLIYRCYHVPAHEWDLSGQKIP